MDERLDGKLLADFLEQLRSIKRMSDKAVSLSDFQDQLVDELNSNGRLPADVKCRIGKMLDQCVHVKFRVAFSVSARLREENWTNAKQTLAYEIDFELLMAGIHQKCITQDEFDDKALDLLDRYVCLLYSVSFLEHTILGVMVQAGREGTIGEIFCNKKSEPNLLKKIQIGGSHQTLL